jgi:hydrogenase nickel incorporation protein HypA/HybF
MSENATLNCIEHGVLVHCPDCEKNSEVAINNLICPICDNWQTELISGDELILERVELESVAAEEKINKIAILRTNC